MENMPEGIEGLPFDLARMIEGALQTNNLNTLETMQSI